MIASQMTSILLFCLASCPVCYLCLYCSIQSNLFYGYVQRVYKELPISVGLELQLLLLSIQFLLSSDLRYPSLLGSSFVSLLCVSACPAIMAYLSSPIFTTCPDHLKCANFILSLMIIIPNPILIVRFLTLFLLVFHSIFRSYLISLA